jgi:hypothetical protein
MAAVRQKAIMPECRRCADFARGKAIMPGRIASQFRTYPVVNTIPELPARIAALDWARIRRDLEAEGWATTGPLLMADECAAVVNLYDCPADSLFRNCVIMARHGFGRGEYKYFAQPLPQLVSTLRAGLYERLAPVAQHWSDILSTGVSYPSVLAEFLARCHAAGQARPTPLLLRYNACDYNCLHQDLYGEHVFPVQATILLSAPSRDFTGGEFVLTEQRPRMQSRAQVVPLEMGEAVIFAVHHRPVQGSRGHYRVAMRHGVSQVRSGRRHTLGVIFHDAR